MAIKGENAPVLLLIDIQHGLVEPSPEEGPRSTPELATNVAHLLQTWRSRDWRIVHVHHDTLNEPGHPISVLYPKTFAPHACATPIKDEQVFIKHVGSAFVSTKDTSLQCLLEAFDVEKIVVIGMDGAQCVNSTTRHGADLGYEMIVVGDACASFGMRHWKTGESIGAEEVHDMAMGMLSAYEKVTTTAKLMEVLGYEE